MNGDRSRFDYSCRAGWLIVLVAALLVITGCGGVEGQQIRDWTFQRADGPHPIHLPVHLNDELENRVARYRLSADVALEPSLSGGDLDLTIAHLPAAVSLRVNGSEVRPVDEGASSSTHRRVESHHWLIPGSAVRDGRLSLELEVVHGWTQSGWLDTPPTLVRPGAVTRAIALNRLFNERGGWFGMVGLSQIGVTFLAIYFWDRRRRAYLWFAIQALTASYYPAYVLGITTSLPTGVEYVLLAQSLSIAPIISVFFSHDFFGLGRAHRGWLLLLAFGMLVPIPVLFSDFVNSAYGTPGVIACVAVAIVYQVALGARLVVRSADRGTAMFFLCCWVALAGSAWVDLWAWIGGGEILDGARPACAGLGLFGIFQAMLLGRTHIRSLQEADRLNLTLSGRLMDLQARQAEIEALNEELRQQVGRRSAHILAALTGSEDPRSSVHLEPQDVLEDRYRVIGALGAGGMGTVYEVERLHDRRRLALKVTHQTRGPDLARLAREAQLATRVNHPNVVRVVDTDVASAGYVYLVMELVEGCSLADREGQGDLEWCLGVLVQILEGLGALHAQGIIHRDLKPANVLLTDDIDSHPLVKITDFGISRGGLDEGLPMAPLPPAGSERMTPGKSRDGASAPDATEADTARGRARKSSGGADTLQLTRTGTIAGTPSYVAPELARPGAKLTAAVDLFSFGVIAYRLLTGSPPHQEAPFLARLDRREARVHSAFAVECPLLPAKVALLLDACLEFSPELRPKVADLLRALREATDVTHRDLSSAQRSAP